MTKRLLIIITAVMTTLLALVVLWQFRQVIIYVLISLAMAATMRPLADRLVGRGFVVRAAWILLYLVVLGAFGFLLFLSIDTAISEIQRLAESLSEYDAWVLPVWMDGSFQRTLLARMPPPSRLFETVTGDKGQLVLPALLGLSQGIGVVMAGVIITLVLSIYWSINQIHFERLWLSLLPSGQRKRARGIWRAIEPDLGSYIRSQLIHSILAGLILCLGYWLLGSPYPVLLALVGALACLVPVVGAALVVIPVLLVGLLTSASLGMFTAVYTLVVLIALGIWVKPRLFKSTSDNPVLTMLLVIALADAFGLIGLIIAPPLSVICQILWRRLVSHRRAAGAAAQVSDLKERQACLMETITAMKEPPPPLVASSMERLALLIAESEPLLKGIIPAEPAEPNPFPPPVSGESGSPGSNEP